MKVSLNSDRNNTFDPENNVINYDPTSGLDIKAGISSPASGFAHELSHAVQFHKVGYIAFVESLEEPILSVDHIVDDSGLRSTKFTYGISAEEARATIFESTVQSQLGEPSTIRLF